MAKIAFWITAGPDQAQKALSGLMLANRLKTVRGQSDVVVYLFGPGVRLPAEGPGPVQEALKSLREAEVTVQACPANVQQMGLDETVLDAQGVVLKPAGEVVVELAEAGYQIIGI